MDETSTNPIHIGQVARMLGVPASTLRYWDEEGLLRFQRDQENEYRSLTYQTLMDVCDVILYRNLSIPIRELRDLPSLDLDRLDQLLEKNRKNLEDRVEALRRTIGQLAGRQERINALRRLAEEPWLPAERTLPGIQSFSFEDSAQVRAYLEEPQRAVIYFRGPEPEYGMAEPQGNLRPPDSVPRLYLRALFQVDAADNSQNNRPALLARARELGYTPGALIGQYLITARENARLDYYEAYLELL